MSRSSSSSYDQFLLFGASIMEQSSTQERGFALAPALQEAAFLNNYLRKDLSLNAYGFDLFTAYIRRLDVVNRGFSGYNTEQGLRVLPKIMPDPAQTRVRFMAILFGSNDACFPLAANGQHVPLSTYKTNLHKLLTHPSISGHKPHLILLTPPPVEERRLEHRVKSQGYTKLNRSNEVTKQYADVSREVASEAKEKDVDVACLDLWTALMNEAGWKEGDPLVGAMDLPENDTLRGLIHDGLHLTPAAYQVFYKEMMHVITDRWPEETPDRLPYVIPAWDDTDAWVKEGLRMRSPNVAKHG